MARTFLAAAALLLLHTTAQAQALSSTPLELKTAFESYSAHAGLDTKACTFPVWNKALPPGMSKAMLANPYVTCPLKAGARVCSAIAADIASRVPVEEQCITGFDRISFLPIVALSSKGGFFVVLYESSGMPLKLAEQLTLGFGPERDYCELSSYLLGQDAKPVAGRVLHQLTEVLADESVCRGRKLE